MSHNGKLPTTRQQTICECSMEKSGHTERMGIKPKRVKYALTNSCKETKLNNGHHHGAKYECPHISDRGVITKFSNEECPKCGSHELEVYNSIIDYSQDPALGYIFFICEKCGEEFEVVKVAEVNT